MKIAILLACLALSACEKMTNDEIIAETKKCRDAGLTPAAVQNGFSHVLIVGIVCQPKTKSPLDQ